MAPVPTSLEDENPESNAIYWPQSKPNTHQPDYQEFYKQNRLGAAETFIIISRWTETDKRRFDEGLRMFGTSNK